MKWQKTYGDANEVGSSANSVVQTKDEGYALAGTQFSLENQAFWLVKTDKEGNMEWNKTYLETDGSAWCVAIQTKDEGYALAGYTDPATVARLIKTDKEGNLLWSKNYSTYSMFHSIVETDDGGYAMAGMASGAGNGDFWLVKTDSTGTVQWEKTYGGPEQEYALSLVKASDGGYLLAGRKQNPTHDVDGWVVKTDSQGQIQWDKSYGGKDNDAFYSATQVSDGGFLVAGAANFTRNSADYGNEVLNPATVVVKFDMRGELKWEYRCEGDATPASVMPLSIIKSRDGGFVFVGTKVSGTPNSSIWLVKVAPEPYTPPETLPSGSEPFPTAYSMGIVAAIVLILLSVMVYVLKRKD